MAIIKDLSKEKRDEYFKRAANAGLQVPNLFLWTEETFEKKIAELKCQTETKTKINEQNDENINGNTEDVNENDSHPKSVSEAEISKNKSVRKERLCHICKVPVIDGKCKHCGEVYYDN